MSLKWQSIVVDCVDPGPLARWWADLLVWRITFDEPDEAVIEPPEGAPAGQEPDAGGQAGNGMAPREE